ncbi:hypothetical protein LAJ19_07160 [Deinococcus taeanensis]|uniref:hypothetical protein n=1 Tax=Deinococcus taeanensis TaxID=2737050 RepID=UPI001CDCD0AA|nr:hypothetical protein [Deinococcus taeanensis]UBV41451.1 hypothetical protein LAJ19_07160 [Deinococcus taeanensis]
MNVIVAPDDRAALWAALPALPVTWAWDELPEEGVTLPGSLSFEALEVAEDTFCLYMTLLKSKPFYTQLENGEGDFTDEERENPEVVIARHHDEASERLRAIVAEATRFLGEPDEQRGDASWLLEDRTISVREVQWDKETPIEVSVVLLPRGLQELP